MDENKEIYNIVINFLNNNYRFGYSFEFKNSYEDIINYWSNWFSCKKNKISNKIIVPRTITNINLDKEVTHELDIIFETHYNSSDNHMILFYIANSNNLLVKVKVNNIKSEFSIPYWSLRISNEIILEAIKKINVKSNNLCVLIYN